MEHYLLKREQKRRKRLMRVRRHVRGTTLKPRLSVNKTNQHLSVQIIDDEQGVTLASAGTVQKEFKEMQLGKKSKESARAIGKKIAELAKQQQIEQIVFDRGRYKYHGHIAELAKAAREAGLKF